MENNISRRDFLKKTAFSAILLSNSNSFKYLTLSKFNKEYTLIKNGLLIDGLGNDAIEKDILIKNDKILKIDKQIKESKSYNIINAKHLVVSPGFIDPHTHTDENLLINPKAESFIRQGVTTEIGGNCGDSPFPISKDKLEERKKYFKEKYDIDADWVDVNGFYNKMENQGISINYASLLGHGTLRGYVIGYNDIEPTEEQLNIMKSIIEDNLKSGVMGLSTGLEYTPGSFAKTNELIELCKIVAKYNSVYSTHLRNEDDTLIEAVNEAIDIAEKSGVSLEISHLKTCYPRNWNKIDKLLLTLESAKEKGINILADRYPYTAFATSLSACFPIWTREGTSDDFINRLKDVNLSDRIDSYLKEKEIKYGSWENVLISNVDSEKNKYCIGKNILELSNINQKNPIQFIKDLLIEEKSNVGMIVFAMSENNLKRILKHPLVVIGSDGSSIAPYGVLGQGNPHPRHYGAFARVLNKYVREEKVLDLPTAIKKMTSITAKKFNIMNRGVIKENFYADITIFDPDEVKDLSEFNKPHQYAKGIKYVLVNGRITINEEEHTGALSGKIIRRGRP